MRPADAEPKFIPVQSSLLARVRYRAVESILELEFCKGAIYRYFDVPPEIHTRLLAAESKGHYFNRHIRDCFQYVPLTRTVRWRPA